MQKKWCIEIIFDIDGMGQYYKLFQAPKPMKQRNSSTKMTQGDGGYNAAFQVVDYNYEILPNYYDEGLL